MNLRAGDRVKVLDAFGTWHDATADSDVEPGHAQVSDRLGLR